MNNEQKVLAGVATLGVLVIGAAIYFGRPVTTVSVAPPSVVVSGDATKGEEYGGILSGILQTLSEQITKLTESVEEIKNQTPVAVNPEDQEFGGTTNWNSDIHTRGDADVDGNLNVDGDTTITGVQTSTRFPVAASTTVTSVATSQLLGSLTRTGSPIRLMGAGCSFVPSAFGGVPRITISGGEEGAAATGTGANLWYDNAGFTLSTASSTLTATSTITGFFTSSTFGNVMWDTNEVIRFMVAAPTTSIRGDCYVW